MIGHYRSAVGALLIFDLTDRESFDCIDHWLKELRENCDENCDKNCKEHCGEPKEDSENLSSELDEVFSNESVEECSACQT